jgi:hypothetical protein
VSEGGQAWAQAGARGAQPTACATLSSQAALGGAAQHCCSYEDGEATEGCSCCVGCCTPTSKVWGPTWRSTAR